MSRNWSYFVCVDGRVPQAFDLLQVALYPQSDLQEDTPLGYCHYPKLYDLPSAWNILPEESDLFLPKQLVDTLTALLVVSVPVVLAFVFSKYVWESVDPRFRAINPSHKKWYVVANLSKSFFLGCLALNTKYPRELRRMFADDFGDILTKRSMALYVVTDVVALWLVPKLPRSTIIHHVATFLLGCVTWGTNLHVKGYAGVLSVAKMALAYGMISCITFLVNAYLALRVVYPNSKVVRALCHLSLVTYLIGCGVNWTYQVYWFVTVVSMGEFSLYAALYITMMLFIVNDDIVLIKWLLKQSSPMADDPQKNWTKKD